MDVLISFYLQKKQKENERILSHAVGLKHNPNTEDWKLLLLHQFKREKETIKEIWFYFDCLSPMAKDSFVMYTKWKSTIDKLTIEDKAKLLDTILSYQLWEEIWELPLWVDLVFWLIKAEFEIDRMKYEEVCKKRADAGKQWGLAKASKSKQKVAKGSKGKVCLANLADMIWYDNDMIWNNNILPESKNSGNVNSSEQSKEQFEIVRSTYKSLAKAKAESIGEEPYYGNKQKAFTKYKAVVKKFWEDRFKKMMNQYCRAKQKDRSKFKYLEFLLNDFISYDTS